MFQFSTKMSKNGTSGSFVRFWCERYGEFKPQAEQISHTLPTTRHCCNVDVWDLAQSCGDGHRSSERVLSEYNEDLIFLMSKNDQNANL